MTGQPTTPSPGSSGLDPAAVAARKAALRAESLARRDALGDEERATGSLAIVGRIAALDLPAGAAVSGFLPIRSEVDLRPLLAALHQAGHPVGLPFMRKPDLVFRRWTPETELVPFGFGTYGPPETAPEVVPDVMLVPLSVFDRKGGRIGYGKAYYDITIARLRSEGRDPRLIGVGFSVQEAEDVPMEAHDIPLHLVLTEREVIRPARP
ncbi:5-formyltetrahydrofolate cyclo-ligase [Chthonobacter rhizosphaerae]|uniref:5-formyltetrahydrofolate cyclo-ligase n=1 Tax=Chthonobacter rhizosphaerae TaxID=2735553 RepID=UPI0015EE807F|nr:5-formyltetrahydrofolate cyclo-ligase [Chthonobacter rhizosphaerae]